MYADAEVESVCICVKPVDHAVCYADVSVDIIVAVLVLRFVNTRHANAYIFSTVYVLWM